MDLKELNLSEEQTAAVQKMIQSETDKVRTDYSTKLKAANEELEKYKPREKSNAEKKLDERISAIEAREKEVADREKSIAVENKLKEKNIPAELSKYLNVGEDVDKSIDEISAALGTFFLGNTHVPGTHASNKGITRDDFKKMSYMERSKLYQENPELYAALSR